MQGKADETEAADESGEEAEADTGGQTSRAEKEKKKMRGKNKSMKRCVIVVM